MKEPARDVGMLSKQCISQHFSSILTMGAEQRQKEEMMGGVGEEMGDLVINLFWEWVQILNK